MKIVNREQFLSLPSGTVFQEIIEEWSFGHISVKFETINGDDFYYISFDGSPSSFDSGNHFEILYKMMLKDESFGINEAISRDGSFEEDMKFMIYEKSDIDFIANTLNFNEENRLKMNKKKYFDAMWGAAIVSEHALKLLELPFTKWQIFKYKVLAPLKEIFWCWVCTFGISLMFFSWFKFFSIFL